MLLRPFAHEAQGTSWQTPCQNLTGLDYDEGLVTLVFDMEMRRTMVGVVHADVDAKEVGNDWHGCYRTDSAPTVLNRDATDSRAILRVMKTIRVLRSASRQPSRVTGG